MPKTKKLPVGSDPVWKDESYRKDLFRRIFREKGLTLQSVSVLTGNSPTQVEQWRAPSGRTIPIPTLRALLYDLDAF